MVLNGKSIKLNRIVILSDVYFLLFEQEKWYKNNLILTFWSSIINIQKIQKVKDSKTLILQWTQKENENYAMSLTVVQRDNFINTVLDKMHQFGMAYDVQKFEGNKETGENFEKKKSKDLESQNQNLLNNDNEEENEDYNEEEEEEEDDENEGDNVDNKENDNVNEKKEEEKQDEEEKNNEDINKENGIKQENDKEKKADNKEDEQNNADIKQDINIKENIKKEEEQKIEKEEKEPLLPLPETQYEYLER